MDGARRSTVFSLVRHLPPESMSPSRGRCDLWMGPYLVPSGAAMNVRHVSGGRCDTPFLL